MKQEQIGDCIIVYLLPSEGKHDVLVRRNGRIIWSTCSKANKHACSDARKVALGKETRKALGVK